MTLTDRYSGIYSRKLILFFFYFIGGIFQSMANNYQTDRSALINPLNNYSNHSFIDLETNLFNPDPLFENFKICSLNNKINSTLSFQNTTIHPLHEKAINSSIDLQNRFNVFTNSTSFLKSNLSSIKSHFSFITPEKYQFSCKKNSKMTLYQITPDISLTKFASSFFTPSSTSSRITAIAELMLVLPLKFVSDNKLPFYFMMVNGTLLSVLEITDNDSRKASANYPNIVILFLLIATWSVILIYLLIIKNGKRSIVLLKDKNREISDQKEELAATLNMVEHLNDKLDSQNQALNKSALVAILYQDGKIESVNEMFTKSTGYRTSDLIDTNFEELLNYDQRDLFKDEILPSVRNKKYWRGELCQFKKDESTFWVDTVFVPLRNDQKENQIYLVQFDISERIDAEQKLVEQNKNLKHMDQLKNKLFSIVSHDFRSPLKSLQGTLTLLNKGAVTIDELKSLSGNLLNKVENTTNFLENILNWAKSQMQGVKLKPQILNINKITHELIKLLKPQADKKFIEIINEVDEEINVVADLEMIKLVLRNLISNALKFSFEEGLVEIQAEVLNDTAVISVTDHGTGIDEEHLENIFKLENYSKEGTAQETGAGLGLILCKDFVEQNNGNIWVTSEIDKGSTFSFSLPIVKNLSEPELINES